MANYYDKVILTDAIGNPIPQKWDPVAGVFVPWEGPTLGSNGEQLVQLTGRNVVLYEDTITVTAGAQYYINFNIDIDYPAELPVDCETHYASLQTLNGAHDFKLILERKYKGKFVGINNEAMLQNQLYGYTGAITTDTPRRAVFIVNDDLSDHNYFVIIGGIK